ncbi:MAG: DUF2726 domain-containing protein [Piscinibacter sp.]|nr:DUF2726 domain-containing protein [Piscinibacter sp.]
MELWLIVAIVVVAALGLLWLRQRGSRKTDTRGSDARIDTVAGWPPTATRVLTSAERLGYNILSRAVPGYMILAQVPLARFLKVPTRHSYAEWLRRLGNQCADLVLCDMSSEVLAVITIQPPAEKLSERGRKRQQRMARVLRSAGIPMHVWIENALPSTEAAREMVMPRKPAPEAGTPVPEPIADTRVRPSRPTPLDEPGRDSSGDEMIEVREPPPSTWFDDFNSGPAPLQQGKRER